MLACDLRNSCCCCERKKCHILFIHSLLLLAALLLLCFSLVDAQVLMGVFGMQMHRRVLETRYHLAYLMIAIVGLGSVAFHGTLHRHCQMLDEVRAHSCTHSCMHARAH